LVDHAVLEDLGEEVGSPEIARKFANDYAGMWVRRQSRIAASVQREDQAAALDAVISLKVASAMVGGSRLAHLAAALESVLRLGDLQAVAALLAGITIQGRATVDELQQRYGQT
jgi:HPt (histidine-containing phosphotransfer) domain-containing protein